MNVQKGFAGVVGQLLVKIEIFLLGDFAWGTPPQGLLRIDYLVAHIDRECHIVRVLLDDSFQAVIVQEFLGIFFDVDHHICTAIGFVGKFDSVRIAAVTGPGICLILRPE